MKTATLSYAKAHWSEILTAVEAGSTYELTRAGKPVALLRAWTASDEYGRSIPLEEIPGASGVLRPAPDAGIKAFADSPAPLPRMTQHERSEPPTTEGGGDHKKTAPAPVLERSPASAPKPLTLADILKAGGAS